MTRDDASTAPAPTTTSTLARVPLAVVTIGNAMFAAGLVCLYMVMRWVTLENGGACASGGPYVIREGQECQEGVFALAYGGIGIAVVGALAFIWASHRLGGSLVTSAASTLSFGAFFGALGLSFLDLRDDVADGGDYAFVGTLFTVFAAVGLLVTIATVVYALRTTRLDIVKPAARVWLAWVAAIVVGAALGLGVLALVTSSM